MIGCLVALIGWFMAIVGLILALVFPFLEGDHNLSGSIVFGIIALAGLFLLLFPHKIVGDKDNGMPKK